MNFLKYIEIIKTTNQKYEAINCNTLDELFVTYKIINSFKI